MNFYKFHVEHFKKLKFFSMLMLFTLSVHAEGTKPTLAQHRGNVFSQFGEDTVIDRIFEVIEPRSKVCIEFGAWDGFHLSNTANLWVNKGWKAILIECDADKYNYLVGNVAKYNCLPILAKVGIGSHSLEAILKQNSIYDSIDLLSVDIDADDYYIFQSLVNIRPRVIICEYNPTMPSHLDIYPEYGKNYMGCSVGALIRLGKEKGYSLVAITDCNCFFVMDEEFKKFSEYETSLEKIRIDKYLRYVITDFAGNQATITSKDFINPYGLGAPLTDKLLGPINRIK